MSRRIAGIAGLSYVLLILASAITFGDSPSVEADAAVIRDYLEDVGSTQRAGGVMAALALPFWALFIAGLIGVLDGRRDDDNAFWAGIAWFGAITVLVCVVLADVFLDILFLRNDAAELDDAAVRLLWDGQFIAYSLMGIGVATLTAAIAIPSLQHGTWPRWHAWLGIVVALIALPGPFALMSASEASELLSTPTFPALLVWTLASAIVLIRSPRRSLDASGDPTSDALQIA